MRRCAVRWSWAALPVAAVAAVLLVLQGQPGLHGIVLFGGHSVDPSMPAPMTGDGAALPNSVQGPWGGVGPGGTFLGRNMAKRRRIIQDQSDLWGRAEQGLGRLVAMSKGEWHPGPSEHGAKPEEMLSLLLARMWTAHCCVDHCCHMGAQDSRLRPEYEWPLHTTQISGHARTEIKCSTC